MKSPPLSSWKNGIISGFAFFLTVTILSVGYAALSGGLSTSDLVSTGSGLTATSWNRLVNGVLELDSRTAPISSSAGSVGIGTTSPWQKLSVAGTIESTSGGFKFPDGTTQITAGPGDWVRTTAWSSTYGNSSTLCQTEFGSQWRVCGYPEIAAYTKDIYQKGIGNIIAWVACGRPWMLQSGTIKKIGISADAADSGTWTCPAANGCNWEQFSGQNGAYLHCYRTESTQQKSYCCKTQ